MEAGRRTHGSKVSNSVLTVIRLADTQTQIDRYGRSCARYQLSLKILLSIRNWFLDTVTEVNDARIIRFLENRFNTGDVSVAEAVQALLLSINHLHSLPELVEKAKVSFPKAQTAHGKNALFHDMVRLSPPGLPIDALQQEQRFSVANRDAHLRLPGVQELCLLQTLHNDHSSGKGISKS